MKNRNFSPPAVNRILSDEKSQLLATRRLKVATCRQHQPLKKRNFSPIFFSDDPGLFIEGVCVCLLLQYLLQSCSRGGRGIVEDMCYERRRAEACVD
jgi:hypothetical protein